MLHERRPADALAGALFRAAENRPVVDVSLGIGANQTGHVVLQVGNRFLVAANRHLANARGHEVTLFESGAILLYLAEHPGQVVSIEDIFTNVWGFDTDVNVNNVKWYVWRLRQKLEGLTGEQRFIFTERGAGYRFTAV